MLRGIAAYLPITHQVTSKLKAFVQSRRVRVADASLIATGMWAFKHLLTEVGGTAYVNAPLIRISAPISGIVDRDTLVTKHPQHEPALGL